MNDLDRLLNVAKKKYDSGYSPTDEVRDVCVNAIRKLRKYATNRHLATVSGKKYSTFEADAHLSRPFLPVLMFDDSAKFVAAWNRLVAKMSVGAQNAPVYGA